MQVGKGFSKHNKHDEGLRMSRWVTSTVVQRFSRPSWGLSREEYLTTDKARCVTCWRSLLTNII